MLRCPKCSRVYQDGTQKFCTNDGARLLFADAQAEPAGFALISRRTPPGELIVETVVTGMLKMSSDESEQFEPAAESNSEDGLPLAPSFKSFGIHSSNSSSPIADHPLAKVPELEPQKMRLPQNGGAVVKPKNNAYKNNIGTAEDFAVNPGSKENKKTAKRAADFPFIVVCILGTLLLLTGLAFAGAYFFREQPAQVAVAPIAAVDLKQAETVGEASPANLNGAPKAVLPANYSLFENQKDKLDGVLAEKFVGFSLGYPNGWLINPNEGVKGAANYLDVGSFSGRGLPIEQLLVSWYDSRGTFAADRLAFPVLAQKISDKYADKKTGIPAYQHISKGATVINGRNAYEIKFAGKAFDDNGKPYKIWGRTVFLPTERENARSGLTLTMLATSLAPALKSVDDVGNKGELAKVLQTLRVAN